jgi:cyclo(L-tyrosyl-L-tyrosyl) synthase
MGIKYDGEVSLLQHISYKMNIILNLEGTAFKTGYKVLEQKGTVIVGMSPGNGYFKKDTIYQLLRSVSHLFKNIKIFIPDIPAQYTYNALGKSITKAVAISRKNSNLLRNHSMQAIDEIMRNGSIVNITISDWHNEIECAPAYHKHKKYIYDLYRKNERFYSDARQATQMVIVSQAKDGIDMKKAVDIAVNYLLEELIFLLASPEIYGVEKTTAVYHRRWPIFENLISGQYDMPISNVGFMLLVKQ